VCHVITSIAAKPNLTRRNQPSHRRTYMLKRIAYFCAYLSSLCLHLLECPAGPQCTVSIEQPPSSEMLSRRGGDSYLSNALDEQLFRLPPIELVDRIRRLQILRQVVGSIQWNEQMWRPSILLARSEKLAQSGNV
jgi:hypothetical protein